MHRVTTGLLWDIACIRARGTGLGAKEHTVGEGSTRKMLVKGPAAKISTTARDTTSEGNVLRGSLSPVSPAFSHL